MINDRKHARLTGRVFCPLMKSLNVTAAFKQRSFTVAGRLQKVGFVNIS